MTQETPDLLKHLPQDLRQITLAQFEAWAKYLARTKTLAKLRQWQRIQEAQIKTAWSKCQKDKSPQNEMGLANCQIMLAVGSAAVDFQTFKDPHSWRTWIPQELRQMA